jgi:hypothetical protein
MKKTKVFNLVTAVLLLANYVGFSQEKPVLNLLNQYVDAFNNLSNTKEKNTVLSLFDSKYKNNTAYVGLSGVIKRTTTGFEQLSTQLDQTLKNKKYNFKITVREIVHESQKERAGTVSALVNFESKVDGKVAETGTILMNLVGSLIKGEWKIIHNNTIRVSEGKDIGNCVSYLFSKGASFFGAETYYPGGVEYNNEFQSFRVINRDGKRIIKGNIKDYEWSENGDVLEGALKVGNASTPEEAVKTVLNYVYADSCVKIDFN